jgi:hypothetical protein
MPLSLPSLNFALICDGNELETHDAKQKGPTIRAFVASEAGKVGVPRISMVSTIRPTVEISNSESSLVTTCRIPTLELNCISMGSALILVIYELDTRVKY